MDRHRSNNTRTEYSGQQPPTSNPTIRGPRRYATILVTSTPTLRGGPIKGWWPIQLWLRPSTPWRTAARYSSPTDPGNGDTVDFIPTAPSQDSSRRMNAGAALHPCSWTSSTLSGSCIHIPAPGPDLRHSCRPANASQLPGNKPCRRYQSGRWFGGISPTNNVGSDVAGPKSMTTNLPTGGSGTPMETGKS